MNAELSANSVCCGTVVSGRFAVQELGSAASNVLASGLATALFTTLAGLAVFLFGQLFLIAFEDWREAKAIERRLKGWRRDWKITLITDQNPNWRDLRGTLVYL